MPVASAAWLRRGSVALLGIAIAIAAYTGFRLPNAWSATLDAVSLQDGFHRRVVVGTVLHPAAVATGYDYRLFAAFGLVVLAALVIVLIVAAMRTEVPGRRLLIAAWFLLPAGGFLFHEVGYLDQVLYLLLVAGVWLLGRGRTVAATCLLSITPFVHEIAILTVIPIFGVVALRRLPLRRALVVTAVPSVIDLIALAIPPSSAGAVDRLSAALRGASFPFRDDALEIFQRSLSDSAGVFAVVKHGATVGALALLLVAAYAAIATADRRPPLLILASSCAAIAAPALLAFAGWDSNRWTFMLTANFFIGVWLALGDREPAARSRTPMIVLVGTLAILAFVPLRYFDGCRPRALRPGAVGALAQEIADGSLFTIPAR